MRRLVLSVASSGKGQCYCQGLVHATHGARSGAWAGLFNTHFWVDRTTGICVSIYANSLPFITDEAWRLYGDFESALHASL